MYVFILLMENFPIYLTCPLSPSVPLSLSPSPFFCSVHKMQFPINVTEYFSCTKIFVAQLPPDLCFNCFFSFYIFFFYRFSVCEMNKKGKIKTLHFENTFYSNHEENREYFSMSREKSWSKRFVCILEVHFFLFEINKRKQKVDFPILKRKTWPA